MISRFELLKPWLLTLVILLVAAVARAGEFEDVCADVIKKTTISPTQEQKRTYCEAARTEKDAAGKNALLAKVWMGAAGVCALQCATIVTSSFGGPCLFSSLGATGVEVAQAQDMSQAMAPLASTGTTLVTTLATLKDGKAGRMSACLGAVMAGLSGANHQSAASNAKKQMNQSLASAKSVNDRSGKPALDVTRAPGAVLETGSGIATGSRGGVATGSGGGHTSDPACELAEKTAQGQAIVQCALSTDPSLPKELVTNPEFLNAAKQASGLDLASLANEDQTPSQNLFQAMAGGGTMSPSQIETVASAIRKMDGRTAPDVGSSYASHGGGSGSAGSGDLDAGAMIQNLLAQFGPKGDEKSGAQAPLIARMNRSPAAVSEDRALSIFDRVTYRYYNVSKRIQGSAERPAPATN